MEWHCALTQRTFTSPGPWPLKIPWNESSPRTPFSTGRVPLLPHERWLCSSAPCAPTACSSRPARRTASSPRHLLPAAGRALAADVAESCPPPRRRRLAGESAINSAEVVGSSLLEAAGCTNDPSGLCSAYMPETSRSSDGLVAVRRMLTVPVETRLAGRLSVRPQRPRERP